MMKAYLLSGLLCIIFSLSQAQYQVPPDVLSDLVNAPQTPGVSVNSTGEWMVLLERPGYKSITELAQPELRIGGIRINPRTNGSSRDASYNGLKVISIDGKKEVVFPGLPENAVIQNVSWSSDGQKIAFTNQVADGLELWLADVNAGTVKQLTKAIINDAMRGMPYAWFPDGNALLVKSVIDNRGEAPAEPLTPGGPVIQETTGQKAAVRTYQDLLQNAHDENLFEYYTSSQLYKVDVSSGQKTSFAQPGIISQMYISPDGGYVFLMYAQKPFSYSVPYSRFPQMALVVDNKGNKVQTIADIPLAENIPKGFAAVRTGPRNFSWRSDAPATLFWVEAQDEGDPANEVEFRDQLFSLEAPFSGEKKEEVKMKLRYGGVNWGDDNLAVCYEWWWTTRQQITSRFKPGDATSKKVLFEGSFEDRYNDPGDFVTTRNELGQRVLLQNSAGNLYLRGQGASPEGNRPFVREYVLETGVTNELWRSQAPYYETAIDVIDKDKKVILTRRESKDENPNYYLRDLKKNKITQVTQFPNPYAALKGVEKQVVKYKRKDGVDLKGDLYLPVDYKESDGPLPVLMWAYPSEYKSADAASQVEGSPYSFIRLGWWSPLYFVTRGFAVFDDPSMPVIGEGDEEPNDTFREQLVMNAEAAIDKLVEMGVADRERIAIGGHSYGAFMTANLLAHSDLFAAGIARSGAFNRTLTPFGFQAEERTYWEAPEVYYSMSPFMHADKINEPLLMIHGEADNNSGTFPIQSKRLYAAIKGLGGNARLVMLPHESHGYRAKESILHMLWEMDNLLQNQVKEKSGKKLDTVVDSDQK